MRWGEISIWYAKVNCLMKAMVLEYNIIRFQGQGRLNHSHRVEWRIRVLFDSANDLRLSTHEQWVATGCHLETCSRLQRMSKAKIKKKIEHTGMALRKQIYCYLKYAGYCSTFFQIGTLSGTTFMYVKRNEWFEKPRQYNIYDYIYWL